MTSLRTKLLILFGVLIVFVTAIGIQSILEFNRLGHAIDVILRENYRSVIACQEMKESLERMDSGALFTLLGDAEQGNALIAEHERRFDAALQREIGNITLPGEGELAESIRIAFERYRGTLHQVASASSPLDERRELYFGELLPTFTAIKESADRILAMNQKNMDDANEFARERAARARRAMYALLGASLLAAVVFASLTNRWILKPVQSLTDSANEVKNGNLDLVVPVESTDEIGRLSEAFNTMAASLRAAQRAHRSELVRSRHATEEVFDHLEDAFAVVDLENKIEIATPPARRHFGLQPGISIGETPSAWLGELTRRAIESNEMIEASAPADFHQVFIRGSEHFFQPMVVPIRDKDQQVSGLAIMLKDVTQSRHQTELKGNLIATVSHQLKTPLTSIRMGLHLLLNDSIGPLNDKQTELLLAARDDSDRLSGILENLLDINRMESGRIPLEIAPAPPSTICGEGIEPFRAQAKDCGVTLAVEADSDLPEVLVDKARIAHVFSNLLSNALRYTPAGGTIRVRAEAVGRAVVFHISDTGPGIPKEIAHRVFEPFFRAPGQSGGKGAGLGLSIVREIVTAHGGDAGVDSEPPNGCDFWFSLPVAD